MLKQSYLKCSKNSQITILLLTGEEKIYSEQNKILQLSSVLAFKFTRIFIWNFVMLSGSCYWPFSH